MSNSCSGQAEIKLTAGGGVSSPHSPLDVSSFTEAELRAAVEAAGNWGTYVGVHAYTPPAVRRAIDAGVQVIEHAHLIDDATARYMSEKGVWLSTQPFLAEEAVPFAPDSLEYRKKQAVVAGTEVIYGLVRSTVSRRPGAPTSSSRRARPGGTGRCWRR